MEGFKSGFKDGMGAAVEQANKNMTKFIQTAQNKITGGFSNLKDGRAKEHYKNSKHWCLFGHGTLH